MSKQYIIVEKSRSTSAWLLFVPTLVLLAYWQYILVWGILTAAIYVIWCIYKKNKDNSIVENARLSMEADHENMMYLQEDDIYGKYQPATMPLTIPILNDYDDGLRNWK